MNKNRCTYCGNAFNEWDEQENNSFRKLVGYGSKYDLSVVEVKLCCNCFDRFIDKICECGAINPIVKELEF